MDRDSNGKYLESKLQEALKEYTRFNPGYFHRFYDTTSTGGTRILPSQPGDFMWLVPGFCVLIECKSTRLGRSLLSLAHKRKVQLAKHKLWRRAGHPSLYLYLSEATNEIEWHCSLRVLDKVNEPLWMGHLRALRLSLIKVLEKI